MGLKKRVCIFIVLIIIAVALFPILLSFNKNTSRLHAKNGVIDISNLNWENQNKYLLSGEWELYDGLLIDPDKVSKYQGEMRYLSDGRGIINPNIHNRTYRLKITTDTIEDISILIPDISAFRLWLNDSLILDYRLDNMNTNIRRMNTVQVHEDLYNLTSDGYELYILLQIQDRISYREMPIKLLIGKDSVLLNTENINLVLNTVTIGCYILVVIYSISLFVMKKNEEYLLYLGLFALNNMLANALDSNLLSVIPIFNIRTEGWIRLINMATLFIPLFIYMICNKLFYGNLSNKKQRAFLYIFSSLAIIITILPLEIAIGRGNLSLYLVRIIVPVNFYVITNAYLKGRCNLLILLGGLIFTAAFIFEVLINTGMIPVGIISIYINTSQYAYLLFTIIIVLTVANKFAGRFDEAEKLGSELEYMNKNLESMVSQKTQELTNSYNEIVSLHSQRQNLLLNISHDLRSPLFVVKGYLEAINDGMVEDKKALKQYLQRMQVKIEYLSRLIEDLFLVFKFEANKIEFNMLEFDMISLIEQVLRDMKSKAHNKNIKVEFKPSIKKIYIHGDKHRIHQVIDNVLSNAIKYTDENGKVEINIWESEDDVIICVKDNGIGISREELPHIFERYYRTVKKSNDDESTGLGLFISHEIIERHGGQIWVESEILRGTMVYIKLNYKALRLM